MSDKDKNNEWETDSLPSQVISNPHHDHQSGPLAQGAHLKDCQPQHVDKPKSQTSELIDVHALLEINKEDHLQSLLDELRLNIYLKTTTFTLFLTVIKNSPPG
ncbi:hypothetical protein ACTFIT_003143 [Dictyostelium discoideum]